MGGFISEVLTIVFVLTASGVAATPVMVSIAPGSAGDSFSYHEFDFSNLAGIPLDGRTLSVDVEFAQGKTLVDNAISVDLSLNQSGALGSWPADGYTVSGYLLKSDHSGLSSEMLLPEDGIIPAQIWPGWPFSLNGQPLLPATAQFDFNQNGAIVDNVPGPDYSIAALVFSGVHFDISLPVSPGDRLIGSRIVFANFDSPILVSPDLVPDYVVHVPEPASGMQLGLGLAALFLALGYRRPAARRRWPWSCRSRSPTAVCLASQ